MYSGIIWMKQQIISDLSTTVFYGSRQKCLKIEAVLSRNILATWLVIN